ncbi:allantoinase AllB [Cohnella hongkongensis]|uniref:Allantoinase AllB n=1 Tax=Cohnella hongkongensis TaxID=178337 RepID=A0ABV9F8H7_9BACL
MQDEGVLDCIVKGGKVVLRDRVQVADIGIKRGMIVQIASELPAASKETIDARGLYVMAGVIDANVHLSEPGLDWEGFDCGSAALAAGGSTTFLDMPLHGRPPTLNAEALRLKLEAARASGSHIDYGLWGGLSPDNLEHLEELAEAGVVGFKAFMSAAEDPGGGQFRSVDDVALFEGMKAVAGLGKVLAVHAESEEIVSSLFDKLVRRRTPRTLRDYAATRPIAAELDAVRRALLFAERTECPLHLVRLSSPQAVDAAWEAKMNGLNVTVETCPHYLVLTDEEAEALGALAKCAPPIRGAREREGLWARLAEGKIDLVASAHSPCPLWMKAGQGEDGFAAREGIAGAQSMLELVLDEGHWKRGLPLTLLSRVLSEAPARRFGLLPRKGRLAVGSDADLVIVNPDAPYELRAEQLLYRHRHSAYEGRRFRSRVVLTMSRGHVVYTADKGIEADGAGEWLQAPERPKRRRHLI